MSGQDLFGGIALTWCLPINSRLVVQSIGPIDQLNLYRLSVRIEKEHEVANIKSQKKRNLTNEKARLRNRAVKSRLKTAVRAVHNAIDAGDFEEAQELAENASRLFDKAASKGVIHRNQAANRKSGVIKLVNRASANE